jgi:hypothetical protein
LREGLSLRAGDSSARDGVADADVRVGLWVWAYSRTRSRTGSGTEVCGATGTRAWCWRPGDTGDMWILCEAFGSIGRAAGDSRREASNDRATVLRAGLADGMAGLADGMAGLADGMAGVGERGAVRSMDVFVDASRSCSTSSKARPVGAPDRSHAIALAPSADDDMCAGATASRSDPRPGSRSLTLGSSGLGEKFFFKK